MTKLRHDNPPRDLTQAPSGRGSPQWVPPAERERRAQERRKDEKERVERAREANQERLRMERVARAKAMGISLSEWSKTKPKKPE